MRAFLKRSAGYPTPASALAAASGGDSASFERPEKDGAVELHSADAADRARFRQLARHLWSPALAHDKLGLSALQQYQVGEHPLTENALGPCFDIRPFDPPTLPFSTGWLGLQLELGQQEPLLLARGQGLDLLVQFNSAHSKTLMALVESKKFPLRGLAENPGMRSTTTAIPSGLPFKCGMKCRPTLIWHPPPSKLQSP